MSQRLFRGIINQACRDLHKSEYRTEVIEYFFSDMFDHDCKHAGVDPEFLRIYARGINERRTTSQVNRKGTKPGANDILYRGENHYRGRTTRLIVD